MLVSREELLRQLESVQAGTTQKDTTEQSSCIAFKGGQAISFSDEVACFGPCSLQIEGAVPAGPFIQLLQKFPEDEVEIIDSEGEIKIKGKGRGLKLCKEKEIHMPLENLEAAGDWQPLTEDFADAIRAVGECAAGPKSEEYIMTCLHIHPNWVEACQPPGTMVATSQGSIPIQEIKPGQRVWSYSFQKWKAGRVIVGADPKSLNQFKEGHLVTKVGQRPYRGKLVVLSVGGKTTRYTHDHECIVRLDDAFVGKYVVYLLQRGNQFRVGVTGPRMWKSKWARAGRNGRSDIRTRMNAQKANACWVLACFTNEAEALAEERYIVARYGVPDMLFRVRPGEQSGSQKQRDAFWCRFGDNSANGLQCLSAYGRDLSHPFAVREDKIAGRRYPGSRSSHMGDVEMKVRACNLVEGMKVLDISKCRNGKVTDKCWVRFKLSREDYNGPVYSMTVDRAHTYVADGIVTHNCDNFQVARWKLRTGVSQPFLVKWLNIKHVADLGMTEFSETDSWVHFRNPAGLHTACRRTLDAYKDTSPLFAMPEAKKLVLPKGLASEVEMAGMLTRTSADGDYVRVELRSDGKLRVVGQNKQAKFWSGKTGQYDGPPLKFIIRPKLLIDIVKKYNECRVTTNRLKAKGGGFVYATVLGTLTEEEAGEE